MAWREEDHPRDDDGKFTDGNGTYRQNSLEPYKPSSKPLSLKLPDEQLPHSVGNSTSHREFTDAKSVDDFFFYDDEHRGLLAKRNSSYGRWERNLTSHQRYVLDDYTSDGYSNINSYLRGYNNGEKYSIDYVKGEIAALDKAIEEFELREPIVTYRSINSDAFWENLDDITALIGTEYSDPAFMSTSPTKDSKALNKDLLMTIKLPKGKGIGAYIDQYNGLEEKEFLLARGSRFKITNARTSNGKYYLEMELIR